MFEKISYGKIQFIKGMCIWLDIFIFGNDRLLSLTKSEPYVMIYKIICLRRQQRIRKIFAQHTKQLNHQQHVVYNQKTTSALMINGH